jgi:type II secretory pathway pseudopilin PulG
MHNAIQIADAKSWRGMKRSSFTWTELLVCLAIIGLFVMLLLPFRRSASGAARRMQCSNNLKQIALALHNYESKYKMLPPAYTVDVDGNRLHSWRSLILPFLERSDLYAKIDFSKAWDDPANEAVFRNPVSVYRCPSSDVSAGQTTYLAIVGEHNCLRPKSGRMFTEIVDGLSNTVILFETEPSKAVHWMCPEDASENVFVSADPNSKTAHQNGRYICKADGSVQFFSINTSKDILRGLATIDGREVPPDSN